MESVCHVAVCLILIQDEKILLMKRANTGFGDGFFALPGGSIDGDEPVRKALQRETKEEIGVDISIDDLEFVTTLHTAACPDNPREVVLFVFKAEKFQGKIQNCEPHKCSEICFFTINELPEDLLPAGREVINNYRLKNPFSEMFWGD